MRVSVRVVCSVALLNLVATLAAAEPPVARPAQGSQALLRTIDKFNNQQVLAERIVGGEDAFIADHPWQVALVASAIADNWRAQFCGGTLIGDRWIVTAAHCVDGATQAGDVAVLRGTDNLSASGARLALADIKVHDGWEPATNDNDIALLRLESPTTGPFLPLLPAAIEAGLDVGTTNVTVTGWGRISELGPRSKQLKVVVVPLQPEAQCNAFDSYDGRVTANMVCAGFPEGGQDACTADSGGPASVRSAQGVFLIGIVSWGDGCGGAKKYGVYTKVSQFLSWVDDQQRALTSPPPQPSPVPQTSGS